MSVEFGLGADIGAEGGAHLYMVVCFSSLCKFTPAESSSAVIPVGEEIVIGSVCTNQRKNETDERNLELRMEGILVSFI